MSVQEQVYELVEVHPNFEIRKYPMLYALLQRCLNQTTVVLRVFRRIANYIFGQNDRSMKIAMTSPVQRWNDEEVFQNGIHNAPRISNRDLLSPQMKG